MPADQHLGGGMHGARDREPLVHPPGAVVLPAPAGAGRRDDAVEIVPLLTAEKRASKSSVTCARHRGRQPASPAMAEMRIEGIAERVGLPVAREIERGSPALWHARRNRCVRRRGWRRSRRSATGSPPRVRLDGMAVLLPLPADIGRTVIFDGHAESAASAEPRDRQEPACRAGNPLPISGLAAGLLQADVSRTAPLPQAMVSHHRQARCRRV
jgi:hypothetical protein